MKRMLHVLLFLPLPLLAQKMKVNEYDKFIKQQRVESQPLSISTAPNMKLSIGLSAIGPNMYVQFIGAGTGAHRIDPDDPVIFLMDNDSTILIKSKGYQGFDIGPSETTYKHRYILTFPDLKKLSIYKLNAIRKYHADDYDDVNVPNEVSEKFKQLCALFIVELLSSDLLHLVETKPATGQAAITTSVSAVQFLDTAAKASIHPLPAVNPAVVTKAKTVEPKAIAPAFPGGAAAWSAFLQRDIQPPTGIDNIKTREAVVQFLVKADGSVSKIQILESAGPAFDKELLRVLKRTPNWKPAIENGRPVDANVTQRIVFLPKETSEE